MLWIWKGHVACIPSIKLSQQLLGKLLSCAGYEWNGNKTNIYQSTQFKKKKKKRLALVDAVMKN